MDKCEVCGREQEQLCSIKGHRVCYKHYQQFLKNGRFLDSCPITTSDPNLIRLESDYAIIELRNSRQEIVAEALIDKEDIETVKDYKWRWMRPTGTKNTGNSVVTGNGKESPILQLHRLLTNCPGDMEVDHINGNRLDNRKYNLRVCTRQENQLNVSKLSNNTSGFKGVWYDKARDKWVAEITFLKTKVSLGRYTDYNHACYTRFVAESLLHKEFQNRISIQDINQIIIAEEDKKVLSKSVQEKLKSKSLIQ